MDWLTKLHQKMVIKDHGKGSVRNYCQEMRLPFRYYNHKAVADIRQANIEQYLQYIKEVHKVGRAKCRSVAQACSFFFKRILPAPYIVPSNLYPKKQFILPNIMTEEEVVQLFAAPLTLKEYCVIGLLYGCGLRIGEVGQLRLQDIESHNQRLKVYQGKGIHRLHYGCCCKPAKTLPCARYANKERWNWLQHLSFSMAAW